MGDTLDPLVAPSPFAAERGGFVTAPPEAAAVASAPGAAPAPAEAPKEGAPEGGTAPEAAADAAAPEAERTELEKVLDEIVGESGLAATDPEWLEIANMDLSGTGRQVIKKWEEAVGAALAKREARLHPAAKPTAPRPRAPVYADLGGGGPPAGVVNVDAMARAINQEVLKPYPDFALIEKYKAAIERHE